MDDHDAIQALGAEDLGRLRGVLMQVLAVSTTEVDEIAEPGLPVLERHPAGETLTEEHERMVVYALGWMLFDVSRLTRDLDDLRARTVSGADQIGKIHQAIIAAGALYPILLRLLA